MRKYSVYALSVLGAVIGLLASQNVLLALCLAAFAAAAAVMLLDYQKATYVLGAYGVIDYILRTFAGGLAGVWDELFLIVLFMLWGWKWLADRKSEAIKQAPLDMPVILFISVMLFMLILNSPDYSISLEGFRAIVQYILWYFVIFQLLKTENGARNVCLVLIAAAGFMAVHGVFQYIVGVEMPAGWVDRNEAGVRTRVYSILTSPNILGSFMTLTAPICTAFAFTAKSKGKKAFYAVLALCMAAALVFTFSRGAWLGFAVAVTVYVLLKDKRMIIPAVLLAVVIVIAVPSVGNRITYMLSAEYIKSSLKGGRLVRWMQGIKLLSCSPWFGIGLGHFGGAVAMNHSLSAVAGVEVIKTFYMDNYYLKTAVESGIIGLFAFVILMYQVFICSLRTIHITANPKTKEMEIGILAGLSGVIVHNLVENVFEVPMMCSCFWLLAAVMMQLWYMNYHAEESVQPALKECDAV